MKEGATMEEATNLHMQQKFLAEWVCKVVQAKAIERFCALPHSTEEDKVARENTEVDKERRHRKARWLRLSK